MEGSEYISLLWGNPWAAVEEPVPEGLSTDALQYLRDTVYAILHVLGGTLDESLPFIGRLVEVNRRLEAAQARSQSHSH